MYNVQTNNMIHSMHLDIPLSNVLKIIGILHIK